MTKSKDAVMCRIKSPDILNDTQSLLAGHYTIDKSGSPMDGFFARLKSNGEVWFVAVTDGEEIYGIEISQPLQQFGWIPPNTKVK